MVRREEAMNRWARLVSLASRRGKEWGLSDAHRLELDTLIDAAYMLGLHDRTTETSRYLRDRLRFEEDGATRTLAVVDDILARLED